MNTKDILFALLRSQLCGETLSEDIKSAISEKEILQLYKISKSHDITHIVASALQSDSLLQKGSEISEKFQKSQIVALYRNEKMKAELSSVSRVFEEEGIAHIPLKGAVIRDLYPNDWMRTSCDIDILVKEEDLDRAVKALESKLEYKVRGARDFHDISLFSKSGVHLELHFNILENRESIDAILGRAWEFAKSENSCRYCFENEFLIFHILAHMSYHFTTGGCGIRSYIDLFLMKKHLEFDESKLEKMLVECSLKRFYEISVSLADAWLAHGKYDELLAEVERFILKGGVYGDVENGIAAGNVRTGGKFKYALQRIFQPYDVIKQKYPILKKYRWLTPVYEVRRWFSLLLRGKAARSIKELNTNSSVSQDKVIAMRDLLAKMELK